MTTPRRFTTHETTESVPGQEALLAAPLEPATRIGQYELIRPLGRGGTGEVHLARDLRLGRLVAVKQLNAHSTKLAERLLTEARTTARCMHENIIVIHEVGEQDGHPYMVLEYLEGQTLRQWMRERTTAGGEHAPVPPGRAVELMLPVVRALAYAHQRGIVHRDLKPENIMLTRSGIIKVLDFGIAKHLSMRRPENDGIADGALDAMSGHVPDLVAVPSSGLIGTLPYMSPEQMKVGVIDHRSDIWTVGVMLFELVTGRHPIPTRTMEDLMRITDEDEPMPSVSLSLPDSNLGPLVGIIDRCLLKRPEHRTPSARVLLAELEALAPGRGVLVGSNGNPFAGLAAFQESDAGRFFGRDHDIEQVDIELRSRPLVAVVAPSGVGKSSLVRASVIPALKRSGEGWDACVVRSGRSPLSQHRSSMELPESSKINLVKTRKLQPRDFATTEEAAPGHGRSASSEEKSPQPVLRAGSYIGQYELIRLLGRGGMGEVHLARDLRLGRLVALRLMRTRTLHPLHTQRFLIEARATARCPHENIVVIHEVDEYHGHPYMVLEYLEGQTLRQWMHEQAAASGPRAPVPPSRAVELMMPVVRALAYTHERGLAHRDLKPENIILTRTGVIKVRNFGIAQLLTAPMLDESSDASTGIAALIRTLHYRPPEQMKVSAIDHRTDIWAVGIMLFELVTGTHPVPTQSMRDLLQVADKNTPMPSVREHLPGIGPLGAVIDRCLIKDTEHRTTNASALLGELEHLSKGGQTDRARGESD